MPSIAYAFWAKVTVPPHVGGLFQWGEISWQGMELLLEAMAEVGVQPPPPPRLDPMTPDQDPPRGDPSQSNVHPVRCDSDPKVHLVVSLVTKVHLVIQVLCTTMMTCGKGTQRRPQPQLASLVIHNNAYPRNPLPP